MARRFKMFHIGKEFEKGYYIYLVWIFRDENGMKMNEMVFYVLLRLHFWTKVTNIYQFYVFFLRKGLQLLRLFVIIIFNPTPVTFISVKFYFVSIQFCFWIP